MTDRLRSFCDGGGRRRLAAVGLALLLLAPAQAGMAQPAAEGLSEYSSASPDAGSARSRLTLIVSMIPGACLFILVVYILSVVVREERAHKRALRGLERRSREPKSTETADPEETFSSLAAELRALDQALSLCLDSLADSCSRLAETLQAEGFDLDDRAEDAVAAQGRLVAAFQELALLQSRRLTVIRKARWESRPDARRDGETDVSRTEPSGAGQNSSQVN